jgi:polyphosphate glucokinase
MGEPSVPVAIGIDVGGTGIKGAAVDIAQGVMVGNRYRVPTPQPSTPQACIAVINRMVRRIARELPAAADAPVVSASPPSSSAGSASRPPTSTPGGSSSMPTGPSPER